MSSQRYYEEMYGAEEKAPVKLPMLYRMLRRFELNRYDLAVDLAPGGKNALDIGCGDGDLMRRLKGKYAEVWGVDFARPRIERARRKLAEDAGLHFLVEDVNDRLSPEDASFDAITVVSVLEHVFDPYLLVAECHRLLRAGGRLIVQVPNVAFLPNRLRLLAGRPMVTSEAAGWDGGHLHYFTRRSLKTLLRDQGFAIEKVTSGGIFARPRRLWGTLLGPDIFIVGRKQ